ncbi:MAG: dephospho-CoA kinase [Flavobacteriia bacterium]|nr:MAG: dephospho-CoA kinase [Flavobacteriia bacterium]
MKIIGLTGGIGSGKTTIAKMFEEQGIPVYYADDEAKKLMNTSSEIRKKLISAFGENSFLEGELNRAYLAEQVFNDPEKLKIINAIVHPEVDKHFKNWISQQGSEIVIQENAILFESGKKDLFDVIITVTAPKELRIKRVVQRDQITAERVNDRINNQMEEEEKIKKSDFVIENIDLEESKKQVLQILQDIK